MRSYNGWFASPNRRLVRLTSLSVRGVEFIPGVRKGPVHTVLGYVAAEVDRRVERAVNPGCWGYNYRPNTNDPSKLSCHASATAIDYNAPKHPNGVRGTWSAEEIREVHQILREVDGTVAWGEDWTVTVDGMHFEIRGGYLKVKRAADAINAKGERKRLPVIDLSNVRFQARRGGTKALPGVRRIQRRLNRKIGADLKVDGWFGPATRAAYKTWQERLGSAPRYCDGIPGQIDLRKLARPVYRTRK